MGILILLIGAALLTLIMTLLVTNLKHWKQQAFKINIIARRVFLRERKSLKSNTELKSNSTKIKDHMELEMIQLVQKEQSKSFFQIYWNTSVKYNHKLVWMVYKIQR